MQATEGGKGGPGVEGLKDDLARKEAKVTEEAEVARGQRLAVITGAVSIVFGVRRWGRPPGAVRPPALFTSRPLWNCFRRLKWADQALRGTAVGTGQPIVCAAVHRCYGIGSGTPCRDKRHGSSLR